jgi:nucleoside-diphosphate kinase
MQHPKNEQTLVLIKPDGIQRSLIGEIISRFERTGLKLVAMKFLNADEETLQKHYDFPENWFREKGEAIAKIKQEKGEEITQEPIEYGRDIQRALIKFMTSGPIVAMVWQGNQAADIVRKIVGGTEPLKSAVGTIRGDYSLDSYELADIDGSRAVRNLIHASESAEEGKREVDIWFTEQEIINYNLSQDKIIYNPELTGIKE